MKKVNPKAITYNFIFSGFLIGLFFIIVLFILGFYTDYFQGSVSLFIKYQKETPFLWLIDLLPIILAFAGYFIGNRYASVTELARTTAEKEIETNRKVLHFIENLRAGNIGVDYKIESADDELGQSLVQLRNKLKRNIEEEKIRQKEDTQRNWVTEGVAKFGEILRIHNENLEDLASRVTSELVKYMEAEQASFFVLNDSDQKNKYFDNVACFAYDRKKFSSKKIEWGEGLVGACALEKQTIFMTNVPGGFVDITSGLGKANPNCILIVPLKVNEEVHGVLELASFKIYEKFEIEFVEKISESIASSIASVKINLQTNRLLKESQNQASKMAEQEEKLKQTIDELKATQREAAKQAEEFISFTNSVNHTLIRAEYDTRGILLYCNTKFLQKLEYSDSSEIIGHHISMFINEKDKVWFNKIWEGLAEGGKHFEGDMKHVTKYGNDLWTMATYVCVRNKEGGVEKILFLGTDITDNKKLSLDYEGQIRALNRSTLKADYFPNGKLIDCNEKFAITMGYSMTEIKLKKVFDFIAEDETQSFEVIWDNVSNRIPFDGRLRLIASNGDEKWFHGTFTAVNNMYGEVAKIVFIANEITDQIKIEKKAKLQTEQLKIQEKKLQQSQIELSKKLKEAREEMKLQFREIETVKVLNEKTLEGALDAVVTINQKNVIEFFNNAAEEMWGFAKDEVIGKPVTVLLPEKYIGKDDNYMGNFFKYSKSPLLKTRKEVYYINRDNKQVPVLMTLSEARVGFRYTLTAFIQNIEVELF